MTTSYNPVEGSPEDFCKLFVEKFEEWGDYGFHRDREFDPRKSSSLETQRAFYIGGYRKGKLIKAYANVIVHPFSQKRFFKRSKIQDIGSVVIASPSDIRLALTDLQNMTGVKLKKVGEL